MISLSNIIIQTEIYPNEIVKLIEDNMASVFAKLIIFFSRCVSMGGSVVSRLHHSCRRNRSCCGRVEARSEMRACAESLTNKKKESSSFLSFLLKFSISNIILRTEIYSIEIEKLIEDSMALILQN